MKTDIIAAVINMGQGGTPGSGLSSEPGTHSFEEILQALGTMQNQQKALADSAVPGKPKGETIGEMPLSGEDSDLKEALAALLGEDGFERIPWILFFLMEDVLETKLPGMEGSPAGSLNHLLAKEVPEELIQAWNGMDAAGRELAQKLLAGLIEENIIQGKLSPEEVQNRAPAFEIIGSQGNQAAASKTLPQGLLTLLEGVVNGRAVEATNHPAHLSEGIRSGNLSPQAAALLVSSWREGRSLDELPQKALQEIKAFFDAHGIAPAEERAQLPVSSMAEQPVSSMIDRVEQFLRSLLLGPKDAADQPGFFQALPAEQLEEKFSGLDTGRPTFSNLFRHGDDILASANSRSGPVTPQSSALPFHTHVHPHNVLGQIVEQMHLFNRPGGQELRVRLHPEMLGEVFIRMRRIQGVLSAEIQTQNVAVKDLIESQLDSLRQRFLQMDLNVDEFHVSVGDGSRDGSGFDGETAEKADTHRDPSPPASLQRDILPGDESSGRQRVNVLV